MDIVGYHRIYINAVVDASGFYVRCPICGKGRGVVQYAALSGIDALGRAIKRKSSGPGLWQAKIHKIPQGPGSEVIR